MVGNRLEGLDIPQRREVWHVGVGRRALLSSRMLVACRPCSPVMYVSSRAIGAPLFRDRV